MSLAGKREAPAQQKNNRGGSTSTRGAGRGRGARGRGAGPRPKQELIQTGGVFSEGLGGDFPSRKKDKDSDASQFSYSNREKGSGAPSSSTGDHNKEGKKEEKNVAGKASFEGWDALWCSDDEGDKEELKALMPPPFISDLRRGNIMPVVLPSEDQPQFLNIINKSARLSLEEDEAPIDEKKPLNTESGPKSRKATPEQLINMLEASSSDLLHLQLPSVIGSICNNIEANVEASMEVDEPDNDVPTGIVSAPPPPSGLPQNRKIGKLQVTRKGRMILKIGGHSIDITSKPTTGKKQGTVLLEVDPNADQLQAPSTFSSAPEMINSLYHLGNVKHNLVGSMTWGALNEKSKRIDDAGEINDVEMRDDEVSDAVDEKKIEQLEKEQSKWGALAEKWATGLQTS